MKGLKTTGKVIGIVGSFCCSGIAFSRTFYSEYGWRVYMRSRVAKLKTEE